MLQYRSKLADQSLRKMQASELLTLCKAFSVPLIINDDPLLAKDMDADGVHVGREDALLSEARTLLGPDKIIGVSCYGSLDLAMQAEQGGADYVAFGSFYPSSTKPNAAPVSFGIVGEAKAKLAIPVVAIGGITLDNAGPLIEAGIDGIAVINALFGAIDIETAAHGFSELFNETTSC